MARKLKQPAAAGDKPLMDAICSSAHQIWQAGLGAFSKAQDQGEDLFSRLVKEGASVQQRLRSSAGDMAGAMPASVAELTGNVGKQAAGSWEKLESVFEDRVARALHSLGVPTQDDLRRLGLQIEELNKSLALTAGKKSPAARRSGSAALAGKATAATKAAPATRPVKNPVAPGRSRKAASAPAQQA
jgi:poly(hydroxyalkanoate) granule-associated protein